MIYANLNDCISIYHHHHLDFVVQFFLHHINVNNFIFSKEITYFNVRFQNKLTIRIMIKYCFKWPFQSPTFDLGIISI